MNQNNNCENELWRPVKKNKKIDEVIKIDKLIIIIATPKFMASTTLNQLWIKKKNKLQLRLILKRPYYQNTLNVWIYKTKPNSYSLTFFEYRKKEGNRKKF